MAAESQDKNEETSYSDAIDLTGFGKYNYYIAFVGGLLATNVLLVGLDMSYTLPAAMCDLDLTPSSKAITTSSVFLGTLSASHVSGLLIDVLGRQYVMVRSLLLTTCLHVLSAFAPNFIVFAILKTCIGFVICSAGIAIFPYLGESCPGAKTSRVIIITTVIASFSFAYSAGLAWLILPSEWSLNLGVYVFHPWRLFYLTCCLPGLAAAILMVMLPESPKFVLACGDKEKALNILKNIYHFNTGQDRQNFPVKCLSNIEDERVILAKNPMDIFRRMWSQTFPLFLPPYLLKVFICSLIYFNIYFCVNAILLWVPEMSNRMVQTKSQLPNHTLTLCEMMSSIIPPPLEAVEPLSPYSYLLDPKAINITGMNDTTEGSYNKLTEIDECKVEIKEEIYLPNLLMGLFQPVGLALVNIVTPLIQKKLAIMLFLFMSAAILTSVTLIPNMQLIITMFSMLPLFIGVVYNAVTCLTVDFFPTNYRGMAVSLCMMFGRLGSIFGNFSLSFMLDSNCNTLFYIFVGCMLLGCAVTLLIETPKPTASSGTTK